MIYLQFRFFLPQAGQFFGPFHIFSLHFHFVLHYSFIIFAHFAMHNSKTYDSTRYKKQPYVDLCIRVATFACLLRRIFFDGTSTVLASLASECTFNSSFFMAEAVIVCPVRNWINDRALFSFCTLDLVSLVFFTFSGNVKSLIVLESTWSQGYFVDK